ncbi:MAG: hypothetical protein SGJ01_11890 [Gemmatimonadota bacterium]|nr:hypothetical protein [Gemmatimonadota bacterium]
MPQRLAPIAVVLLIVACRPTTGALPPDLAQRFAAEHIVRQADDQTFRYTYYSRATQGPRWEERDASIIVTQQSVFVHKNGKVGLDLSATSRKATEVRRDGDRVIIGAGSGQSKVLWSFRPPEDAAGWAASIRAVIGPAPGPDPYLDPK